MANIAAMGLAPEDQVRAALRAAFGNADRAVDYLMNGIPEGAAQVGGRWAVGGSWWHAMLHLCRTGYGSGVDRAPVAYTCIGTS